MRIVQLVSALVVSLSVLSPAVEAGTISFEEFSSQLGAEGFQYQNGPVSNLSGPLSVGSAPGGFASFSLSSKSTFNSGGPNPNAYFFNGEDTVSATGTGAGGSEVWMNLFNYSLGDVVLALPEGYRFTSIDLTNSLLNLYTYQNGLGTFSDPLNQPGDFFDVRIAALDAGGTVGNSTGWISLAAGPANFLNQWTTIDISNLNTNLITFEFQGSDVGPGGPNTPTYLSVDNLVFAVPEPASCLALTSIGAVTLWRRRRSYRAGNVGRECV